MRRDNTRSLSRQNFLCILFVFVSLVAKQSSVVYCGTTAAEQPCTKDNNCLSGNCVTPFGGGSKVCGCTADNQCSSGSCDTTNGRCRLVFGSDCVNSNQCANAPCVIQPGATDKKCGCATTTDCPSSVSYTCDTTSGKCMVKSGFSCTGNGQCDNNNCVTQPYYSSGKLCGCDSNSDCGPFGDCAANGKCLKPFDGVCQSDDYCSSNAKCIDQPYSAAGTLTCGCKQASDCSGLGTGYTYCAPGGRCRKEFGATCSLAKECKSFECVTQPGDTKKTCGCETDSDCGGGATCLSGKCLQPFGGACSSDAYCLGSAKCVTQPGAASATCGCTNSGQCTAANSVCKTSGANTGKCLISFGGSCPSDASYCDNSAACITQPYDVATTCGCKSNSDCTNGDFTQCGGAGRCRKLFGASCSANKDCVSSKCVAQPYGGGTSTCGCETDSDCSGGTKCETTSGKCLLPFGGTCLTSDYCGNTANCINQPYDGGALTCGCKSDSDCTVRGEYSICGEAGRCRKPFGLTCSIPLDCRSGHCVIQPGDTQKTCGCKQNSDCPLFASAPNQAICDADNGKCQRSFGEVCDTNAYCVSNQCTKQTCDTVKKCGCKQDSECASYDTVNPAVAVCMTATGKCHKTRPDEITSVSYAKSGGVGQITIGGTFMNQFAKTVLVTLTDNTTVVYTATVSSQSTSSVVATVPSPAGKNLILQLNDCGLKLANTISFPAPVISDITPDTDLSPGDSITITGDNIGNPSVQSLTVEGLPCKSLSTTASEIVCVLPGGVGNLNEVLLYAGPTAESSQANTNVARVAYKDPTAVLCDATVKDVNLTTTMGGDVVTICGSHFGEQYSTNWTGVREVDLWLVKGLQILNVTDYKLVVKMPALSGANLHFKLNMNGVTLTVPFIVNYPPPVVNTASYSTLNKKRAAGYLVSISGYNFGPNLPGITRSIYIGGFPCSPVTWISQQVLTCTLPASASGSNLPVSVSVANTQNAPTLLEGAVVDLPNPVTTGLSCTPPNGARDTLDETICNCFSGFAPSDPMQPIDCKQDAKCPGIELVSNRADGFPLRPTVQFSHDQLIVVQKSPIVDKRRDSHITFGSTSASTCNYPGPIWTKTLDTLDCYDVFTAVLAWSQHAMCGFTETSVPGATTQIFSAHLVHSVRDYLKNTQKYRYTSNSFLVSVKFHREVKVVSTVTAIVADATDANFDVQMQSDLLYDTASENSIITFDTIIESPYKLSTLIATWTGVNTPPTGGIVNTTVTLLPQPADLDCPATARGYCEQRWVLVLDHNSGTVPVCDLRGDIKLSPLNILCRDKDPIAPCDTQNPIPATIKFMSAIPLCTSDSDKLDVSKDISSSMVSFVDNEHSESNFNFFIGDMVHFQIFVSDPHATIDKITFNSITLTNLDNNIVDTLLSTTLPLNTRIIKNDIYFNVSEEVISSVSPSENGLLGFSFKLTRNELDVLDGIDPQDAISLKVEAVLDIFYHGNYKRSLSENNNGQNTHTVSNTLSIYYDETRNAAADEINANKLADTSDESILDFSLSAGTNNNVHICMYVIIIAHMIILNLM